MKLNKGQKVAIAGAAISSLIFAKYTSIEDWKSIGGAAKKYWTKISKVGDILWGDNGSRNQ